MTAKLRQLCCRVPVTAGEAHGNSRRPTAPVMVTIWTDPWRCPASGVPCAAPPLVCCRNDQRFPSDTAFQVERYRWAATKAIGIAGDLIFVALAAFPTGRC